MPNNDTPGAAASIDLGSLWLKRVLLPFWVLRLVLLKLSVIIYIVALIALSRSNREYTSAIAVSAVLLAVVIACIVLDLISVFMLIRRRLKPLVLLIFNIIITIIWTVLFTLQVVRSATGGMHRYGGSALTWLFSFIIFLASIGLLIYAIVIHVRYRKTMRRGHYVQAETSPAAAAANSQPEPISEGYDAPMAARYPGGGAYEYYKPEMQQQQVNLPAGQYGAPQYRTRDFAAAANGLTMSGYHGGHYGPRTTPTAGQSGGAAGSNDKQPGVSIAEQPLERGSHIR